MLKYIIRDFFKYMGSNGFAGAESEFTIADFGLLSRIQEALAYQNKGIAIMIGVATGLIILIISIFATAILLNQRKIKKMLRELTEAQQKQEPKEDKPAGEP